MFYYKKEKDIYYLWGDNMKGKFGPFVGIFVKNKYFGNIKEDFDKYPAYKYSIGVSNDKIFVVGKNGVENILDKI